jgi:type I restriction enzyme S subunit
MRKYLKYKETEVKGIPSIPKEWVINKIKFVSKTIAGGTPDTKNVQFWENGTIPWLPSGKVHDCNIYEEDADTFITELGLKGSAAKLIPANSILIALTGATCANIAHLHFSATANQSVVAMPGSKKIENRYLFYCLLGIREQILINKTGGAQSGINDGDIKNTQIPFPSLPEQHAIVRFLDYKTGQIDSFIANRQKQIELLKEQLYFKINHAITKGINGKAKFKSTDIKYVAEIPEHWDIRKFKSLTSILTCGVAATPEYVDESEGVLFLSAQNVKPFRMVFEKLAYIKPELHKKLTRYKKPLNGDVLVTRVGGESNIGDACIVDTEIEFSVYVSLTHIRPNKEILSEYIVYFFNTEYCYQLNHEGTVAGGGQGNLNVKNVERYRIPLPPIEEQKLIIAYLDNYRLEMDNLISKYQKQIDLMQEYRTSLISQAVTGKIDVREWVPKKQQTA